MCIVQEKTHWTFTDLHLFKICIADIAILIDNVQRSFVDLK